MAAKKKAAPAKAAPAQKTGKPASIQSTIDAAIKKNQKGTANLGSKASPIQQAIDAAIRKNQQPGKPGGAGTTATLSPAQLDQLSHGVMPTSPAKAAAIGGAAGGDAAAAAAAAAGATPQQTYIPTDDEWLAGDSAYQDQVNSSNRSLADTLADSAKQRRDYDSSYNDDLRQLGYVEGGGWNTADPLTQSGKAFSSATNDFAARGMTQSTGYGDALTNTTRQFNQQVTDASQARQQYDSGLDSLDAANRSQTQDSITQAKRAAIARKSAQYAVAASGVLS